MPKIKDISILVEIGGFFMNRMKWLAITIISLTLILTLGSCTKPPTAEADAARAAVEAAESNPDVPVYAANTLARAKDSLSRMESEITAKNYDSAKALALETEKTANEAVSEAKTAKERAKSSASSLLDSLKINIAETEKALASAKKTRGIKLDFAAASAEIAAVKKSADSAGNDFNSGAFKASIEKGESAQSKLSALNKLISDAVRSASKKK